MSQSKRLSQRLKVKDLDFLLTHTKSKSEKNVQVSPQVPNKQKYFLC